MNYQMTMKLPNGEDVAIRPSEEFNVELNEAFFGVPVRPIPPSGSITVEFNYPKTAQRILHDRQKETGRPARVYIPEPLPWE